LVGVPTGVLQVVDHQTQRFPFVVDQCPTKFEDVNLVCDIEKCGGLIQ